jgi:hypothetical protein
MRSTPVKYHRWVEEAPESYPDTGGDGCPAIALCACIALVGAVFGLLALIG